MNKVIFALAAVLLTTTVANAATATCAADLAQVKARFAAGQSGHRQHHEVGIAAVKIAEAESALLDHDEDACIGFVHAANAELTN